jgi:hypothetical protein
LPIEVKPANAFLTDEEIAESKGLPPLEDRDFGSGEFSAVQRCAIKAVPHP